MPELSKKERIAKRVVQEFRDGDLVNLGIGLPLLCTQFIQEKKVLFHAENGVIGSTALEEHTDVIPFLVDAGAQPCALMGEGVIIDSATSFGIVRGGHLNATVLGAMQIDEQGNLANWYAPGGHFSGMGGAMDLVVGAQKVIVATEHCSKSGEPKILKRCTFPLTGEHVVDLIVTELAVFEINSGGITLVEIAEDATIEEIKEKTEAHFTISSTLKTIRI